MPEFGWHCSKGALGVSGKPIQFGPASVNDLLECLEFLGPIWLEEMTKAPLRLNVLPYWPRLSRAVGNVVSAIFMLI